MSLPFYKIFCSECSFEDGYSYSTHFEFSGNPSRKPKISVVYCKCCDSISSACTPYTMADAEYEISDLQTWVTHNKKGVFAKFSKEKNQKLKKQK